MIRRILCAGILALLPFAAGAQDGSDDSSREPVNKHQVIVWIGGSTYGSAFTNYCADRYQWGADLASLYGATREYGERPNLMFGYSYLANPEWRFGVEAGWSRYVLTETPGGVYTDRPVRNLTQQVFTVLPTANWIIVDGKNAQMYIRAGLGAHLETGEAAATKARVACQFTPLAVQIGKKGLSLNLEFGLGNVYIVRAGVGYSF